MRLRKDRQTRSALDLLVDLAFVPLGIWLVLDGMGVLTTVVFVGANVATLFIFRNPLRRGVRVHSQPWELPMALVFFSALFAWPALQVIGLERAAWSILNFAVLVVARTLMSIGTILDGQERR